MGIKNLREMNRAFLMKLDFRFVSREDELLVLLKHKFRNKLGAPISSFRPLSIWRGISLSLKNLAGKMYWTIKSGEKVDFCRVGILGWGNFYTTRP